MGERLDLPRLSGADIEKRARRVIEYFNPRLLESPAATPVEGFIEQCSEEFGLLFEASVQLGETAGGQKLLGAFAFRPRSIRIDVSLKEDPRRAFVLAHEFGHFVLHRNLTISKDDYSDHELSDTVRDLVTGRKILHTPRDWIEWQANRFASSLLMPIETIRKAVVAAQSSCGIVRNLGSVYVEQGESSLRDFHRTLELVARVYDTTRASVRVRLSDLGILVDQRDAGIRHISDLLRAD